MACGNARVGWLPRTRHASGRRYLTCSAVHTRPKSSVLPQVQGLIHAPDPVWGPDGQQVRGARRRLLLLLRVMLMVVVCCGGLRGVVQHVHRGLVRGQGLLPGQHREHRLIEPGLTQPRRQPGTGLVHPAGRDRHSQQHGHDLRGPLGRHVPVRGQHHCGGIQHRPVGHRARVRAGRRFRERDRPAARAYPAREQVRSPPG
jgi:hypothetical protein